MVIVKINADEVSFDGYLNENLDILQRMVELKWDGLGYICGYEGDGKSVIASQIIEGGCR